MSYNKLEVKVKDVKSISDLSISIELKPGLTCLVGGNGSGKSTILNIFSQIVEGNKIERHFSDEKRGTSEISITIGNDVCSWKRNSGKWIKTGYIKQYKGFLESGVIYGNRFNNSSLKIINKYCEHYSDFDTSNMIDANEFIVKNLGKILKGNENNYKGLKTITKSFLYEQANNIRDKEKIKEKGKENDTYLIKMERPFLLLKDSGYITQYKMSSGEYLLLKILDYIYYRITYSPQRGNDNSDPFLIIIDEVEIALHPASQKRLIQFCNKVSKEHGICIIFSTHSRDIISNLNQDQIYLIESHLGTGKVVITTPCYPNYAIRGIYEASGYDYIVCVEDELAKKIVTETIKKKSLSKNKLVNVSALGGWREVLRFTHEFKTNGLFNYSKMVIVLDGDMEEQFHKENGSPCRGCDYHSFIKENKEKVQGCGLSIPKLDCRFIKDYYPYYQDVIFLPISSLEKEVRERLIINADYDLISSLEAFNYFGNSSVSDVISSYETKASEYFQTDSFKNKNIEPKLVNFDADGKILWRLLTSKMRESVSVNDLVSYFCDVLPTIEERTAESWLQFEKNLAILLQKPL
ncbi:AAA family ATPase [Pectobacterium versatile]|uniref:AAA family ATPase n=1 Tax=Pectobacterium versatile TaxID=2488639 RepID=UPI000F8DFAB4|nr:AAA family ATPase [Pectobacterium versatile]RUR94098.1 AAA family ATPase [Pectobacterium versatile]